jgi:hypothetical protein
MEPNRRIAQMVRLNVASKQRRKHDDRTAESDFKNYLAPSSSTALGSDGLVKGFSFVFLDFVRFSALFSDQVRSGQVRHA